MEYRISFMEDSILIKVLGSFNRNAIHSVGSFLKPFLKGISTKITLDIDGLKDEREIVFHFGLVNAFRKEIDQAGGKLYVRTSRPVVRKYLAKTGLDKIFNTKDEQFLL